ncbi:C4-dicarboxylate ABC transporter substrate-binding protein [Skermanella stibiiresistens SB22]|uniref:C4-dicarboxylate ABC transporter substrate-binding protein n=1 Tax=Skermanella stibiiresistens SB22 TaxID=1385369 RepID=W9HAH6_9PROT|nr:TAXI family TRAP transporter solute-binding subunit [Skermanella stibiiresistens]EWY41687.1 C4-dicarboxylate ABC transporter substrate-binding protein [Skermanella stibiiresistens SB22]
MIKGFLRVAAIVLALGATTACERMPDEATVRDALQGAIGSTFEEPTFEVAAFERVGSGPLTAGDGGTERKIVYYNADLRLLRDYSFNDWEALNVSAIASLLGATEHGLQGVRRDGNAAGDTLRVRGSVGFERADGATDNDWRPVVIAQSPVTQPPTLDNTGPPAVARGLVDQIMALFEGPPADNASQARAIITEELDGAYRQITLRLDRLQRAFVIAGGPRGGEYDLIAQTIAASIAANGVRSTGVSTDGTVDNLRLISDGSADVALAQNDIAAMASRGEGLYQEAGADPDLRALASLFPESVHIVVKEDGPIRTVADLRGKRVDMGLPSSGSMLTARAVLEAHGLGPQDFSEVTGLGPSRAVEALNAGEIDALVSVINAPARLFQRVSAESHIRFLPLDTQAIQALGQSSGHLVPLTLPPGIYPRQTEPVRTVAVTALLVGRRSMPDVEVTTMLDTVFKEIDFTAVGSGAGAMISRGRAESGLSIPLHPAAEAWLGDQSTAATQ